ncbi:MAG: HD domain-containing protein [Candidatus Thorarchaeota archaeon]|jgi:5'-deoxynucleotidase YfbR-like HD superfamily hydrolase
MKPADIIRFCLNNEILKQLHRTGWDLSGVHNKDGESVASHIWGTSLISLLIALNLRSEGKDVDMGKLLAMANVHDLPESQISDIPKAALRFGGSGFKNGKRIAERNAMKYISELAGEHKDFFLELWSEIEDSKSIEAKIVMAADYLDMLIHAIALERAGVDPELTQNFFDSVQTKIDASELEIASELMRLLQSEHESNLNYRKKSR